MSFMEGFAGSLGQYFTNRAAQEQDDATWEKRQKKMMELESQRITSIIYSKGANGEVIAQPVNAAEQPVGPPRPASPAEAQKHNEGLKSRDLEYRKTEAAIKADEVRARAGEADIADMDRRAALEKQQADSYKTAVGAQAVSAAASAEEARARTRGHDINNRAMEEFLKANPGRMPNRSSSKVGDNANPLTNEQKAKLVSYRAEAAAKGWDLSVLEGMPEDAVTLGRLMYMAEHEPEEKEETSTSVTQPSSLDRFFATQR